MLRRILAIVLVFIGTSVSALSENLNDLSFKPFVACKKPPISPSKKLLERWYKTYVFAGNWEIFDINGDGWCDWVRGGNEGYRSDQESPPLREFIYIGTAKGWRQFDKKNIEFDSEAAGYGPYETVVLSGSYSASNLVEPIAIYSQGRRKPYVVAVTRWDAPAPPPDREYINVFQWDDELDKLRKVPEKDRLRIVDFLHEKLCKDRPELTIYGDSPFLLAQGDLCFPRE
jgi:hypothetical protein